MYQPKWIRFTSKNNPCPGCEGERKDCRQNTDTGLLHCRGSIGYGWVQQGTDKQGFPMYRSQNEIDAYRDEKNRERLDELKAQRERDRQKALEERSEKALSIEERDRQIKALLSQLTLDHEGWQECLRRGLTDAQVKKLGVRSVEQWQKLAHKVNPLLPGVSIDGDSLIIQEGLLIPVPMPGGLLCSWQNRLMNASDGGKYRWAKGSDKQWESKAPTSHIFIDGKAELPIGYYAPDNLKSGEIWLTESTGFKPFLASERSSFLTFGASGGQFASSSNLFKAYLKQANADYGEIKRIAYAVDAGAVKNSNVIRDIQHTATLVKSCGYELEIVWWGQIDKSAGDIDEIDFEATEFEYLSADEFLAIARRESFKAENWSVYRKHRSFKADTQMNSQYVTHGMPQANTITLMKSSLGTGKTTWLVKLLAELSGYGGLSLGYRNTLLLQFCEKSGFLHLHNDDADYLAFNLKSRLALCVDSLQKFSASQLSDRILVIDEVVSVIKHLLFSSTISNKDYSKIFDLFVQAVVRANRVICLDGMMADWVVNFFKSICPGKKIVTVENTYKQNKAQINWIIGVDQGERVKANDYSPMVRMIVDDGSRFAVCSDSQMFLEGLERLLLDRGASGIRIDSTTSSEAYVKDFLKNPTEYIQTEQPDYVLYSPSAESGLDIPIKDYFNEHYGLFFGVIDVDSIVQMLGRIRDAEAEKYIWVKERSVEQIIDTPTIKSSNAKSFDYYFHLVLNRDLAAAMSGRKDAKAINEEAFRLMQEDMDETYDLAIKLQAMRNHERFNLRKCVQEALEQAGHRVNVLEPLKAAKISQKELKEAKDDIKDERSLDIFNASDRFVGNEDVALNFDASWERRCELIKAKIIKQLPGVNHTMEWSPKFIRLIQFDDVKLVKKLETLWLVQNPHVSKRLSQEKYHGILSRYLKGERIAPWKLRQQHILIDTYFKIGLPELLGHIDQPLTLESEVIQKVIKACSKKSIIQVLGSKPGKTPMKFIGYLVKNLGFKWESSKQLRQEHDSDRSYIISTDKKTMPARQVILDCIESKWQKYKLGEVEVLDWFLDELKNARKSANQENKPKITSKPVLASDTAGADKPYLYIKNSAQVPQDLNPNLAIQKPEIEVTDPPINSEFESAALVIDVVAEVVSWGDPDEDELDGTDVRDIETISQILAKSSQSGLKEAVEMFRLSPEIVRLALNNLTDYQRDKLRDTITELKKAS